MLGRGGVGRGGTLSIIKRIASRQRCQDTSTGEPCYCCCYEVSLCCWIKLTISLLTSRSPFFCLCHGHRKHYKPSIINILITKRDYHVHHHYHYFFYSSLFFVPSLVKCKPSSIKTIKMRQLEFLAGHYCLNKSVCSREKLEAPEIVSDKDKHTWTVYDG